MRSKPIPKVKEQLLRQIISRNPSRISHPVSVNIETIITLRIDSTTHQNLQTKARLLGLTLESYLVKAMMHIIDT